MRYLKNKDLLVTITVYIFITICVISKNNKLYINIINPIFWSCILVYIVGSFKKNYVRFSTNRKYLKYMIIISCIYVVLYFYLGFIFGFSKSPYSHDIGSILKNTIILIVPVVVIEIARSVIINRNKNNNVLLAYMTVVLILVQINYNTLFNLYSNKEEFFKYMCEEIFPLIAYNILYTYLALKGSYSLPLVYKVFKEGEKLLLPILPDINWFISGSLSILSSTIIYVLYKYKFIKEEIDIRKKKENTFSKINYAVVLILAITLVCFMLGAFKYEPIVILSNSMVPIYSRADVVIYKKLNEKELYEIPKNSIIVYSVGEQNVAHRIVDIISKDGEVMYQTRGDSNNVADNYLVEVNQIKGVYTFHIKYIGYPSVWLYEYFNKEK